MKIEILFGQFYKEYECEAIAGRLFDGSRCIIQFASMLPLQIDFEIIENPWKSMGNWQNLMPVTEFHEIPSTLACCSSELRRFREMLRYNFNTYSRRYVDCRAPYPVRIAGRASFFERHSEIFRFWPVPEHATACKWPAVETPPLAMCTLKKWKIQEWKK